MPSLQLHLENQISELCGIAHATSRFLDEHNAPPDATFFAELVIEELASNTIKYGYADEAGHEIEIALELSDNRLEISVIDDGQPFNPLEQPEPDTSLPAEERPIGGLGLHLVRKMSDTVEYHRKNGRNIVTVTKTFPPPEKS